MKQRPIIYPHPRKAKLPKQTLTLSNATLPNYVPDVKSPPNRRFLL